MVPFNPVSVTVNDPIAVPDATACSSSVVGVALLLEYTTPMAVKAAPPSALTDPGMVAPVGVMLVAADVVTPDGAVLTGLVSSFLEQDHAMASVKTKRKGKKEWKTVFFIFEIKFVSAKQQLSLSPVNRINS